MFELTISKQQLLAPLLTVAGAVDKKQSVAILANILLKLVDNELCLSATDLEIEIAARVPCNSNGNSGIITVPAKKFVDIIRSLDDDANPTISFDADLVTIKEGRSRFKVATLSADSYPSTTDEANEAEFFLQRLQLIQLLQATHFAMSQQDVRVYLNGLLLELDSQSIVAVAADGHRMAVYRLPCTVSASHQRLLIPRKGIQEILRLLNSITDEQVLVNAGSGHFKLVTSQYTFLSKLIEARFPSYMKAIPREHCMQLTVERDVLKRALTRIVILANEKSRAILLHIQDNQITLIANNQEKEEAIETLAAETQGEELKIGVNASYLLDVLNYLNDGLLRLSMTNNDSSILVESLADECFQYIIMPMKI